jgi:aspartyl-tRNA(Asn)/glutamyl-tRNA(Gln) amidotransferase subunit A
MSAVLHNFPTLASLQGALAQGKLSATELAQDCLKQIQAQQALNAFVHIDAELTLAQARAADASRATGMAGPLSGIPIAHKDVFVTQGWRSTAGSNMLKHYVSPFDALSTSC